RRARTVGRRGRGADAGRVLRGRPGRPDPGGDQLGPDALGSLRRAKKGRGPRRALVAVVAPGPNPALLLRPPRRRPERSRGGLLVRRDRSWPRGEGGPPGDHPPAPSSAGRPAHAGDAADRARSGPLARRWLRGALEPRAPGGGLPPGVPVDASLPGPRP